MDEAPISLLSQEDNNTETSQNQNENNEANTREQVDMMEIQSIVLREFTEKANSILQQLHAAKQSYELYKPSGDTKTSGAAVEEPVAKKVKVDHRLTTNDRQCTSADRDSDTISLNPSDINDEKQSVNVCIFSFKDNQTSDSYMAILNYRKCPTL